MRADLESLIYIDTLKNISYEVRVLGLLPCRAVMET